MGCDKKHNIEHESKEVVGKIVAPKSLFTEVSQKTKRFWNMGKKDEPAKVRYFKPAFISLYVSSADDFY